MPTVTYHLNSGEKRAIEVPLGESVMKGAFDNALPGIEAECGGSLTCATCHVHVPENWYGMFPEPDLAEKDLLDIVEDYKPENSRLSCQLLLTAELDGLEVFIPQG